MALKSVIAASLAVLTLSGSAIAQNAQNVPAADPLSEMRQAALSMPPKLLEVLNGEIAKGGHASAITVCREKAPAMAKALSEAKGMMIRRVSLKNRNPKAVPDAWEQQVLEDFDKRALAGEKPATLEASTTVVEEGKQVMRYMKALPTQEVCLACHGAGNQLDPSAKVRLQELYPDDKATGYQLGQIRGAITVKKAL